MPVSVVNYKVSGFKELSDALDGLTEPKFRKAALRKAGREAMRPTLALLKQAAPQWWNTDTLPKGRTPGELSRDLKMSVSVNVEPRVSKSGKITNASKNELHVIIRTTKQTEAYAKVTEYGRKQHSFMKYTVFGKPVLGFTATLPELRPKPWMRPTFDREKGDIIERFRNELQKSIEFQAKKQKKYKGK